MAKRAVQRKVSHIDPMFFIPEGVEELKYKDEDAYFDDAFVSEGEEVYEDALDFELDDDNSDVPLTPDIYGIVSQRIRRASDGTTVVDVVIEVEDSMSEYDIRVAKI